MQKRKLNYRFHDPNPAAETADYLLKLFLEVNQEKVRLAMQAAADTADHADETARKGRSV